MPAARRARATHADLPPVDARDGDRRLEDNYVRRFSVEARCLDGRLPVRGLAQLAARNQDYREASRFIPPAFEPELEFYRHGTGPFAGHDPRLKRRYIQEG